jgi:hypothetical protein
MPPPLESAAARACRDPFFLGWALAAYQKRRGLDDAALAAELGLAPPWQRLWQAPQARQAPCRPPSSR